MKKSIFYIILIVIINSIILNINGNSQWIKINAPTNGICDAFTENGTYLFAGFNNYPAGIGGVYISTNEGLDWIQTSFSNKSINTLTVSNSIIFAGFDNYPSTSGGLTFSENNGQTWNSTLFNNYNVRSLVSNSPFIFAGGEDYPSGNGGVYRSTNNGLTWAQISLNNQTVLSLAINGTTIYAGCDSNSFIGNGGVYVSTNNGQNWIYTSTFYNDVKSLLVIGSNVYAGTNSAYPNGLFKSTNNGQNWTQTTLNNKNILCLANYGTTIFAGCWNNGVYYSTNEGQNWTSINQGFGTNFTIRALLIKNNYIFAGTYQNGIYRRPLSEIITKINNISSEITAKYSLMQNKPNPFNPLTKIQFDVAKINDVLISVFDISGKELEVIVNERMQPGTYEIEWNGEKYASGIYFYTLYTNEYKETKRMILLK